MIFEELTEVVVFVETGFGQLRQESGVGCHERFLNLCGVGCLVK